MKITLLELKQLVKDIVKESSRGESPYADEYQTTNGNVVHYRVNYEDDLKTIKNISAEYLKNPTKLGFGGQDFENRIFLSDTTKLIPIKISDADYWNRVKDNLKKKASINENDNSVKLYHHSYTDAINTALDYLEKRGYTYDKEDSADIIGIKSKRPDEGKTTRIHLPIYKNGKLQRKQLHILVYNRGDDVGNRYELTTYIS